MNTPSHYFCSYQQKLKPAYNISFTGDHAITIQFGDTINIATHKKAMALFHHLQTKNKQEIIRDIIPSYCSVTIVYNIMAVANASAMSIQSFMLRYVEDTLQHCNWDMEASSSVIHIPVCYDTRFGIDLEKISAEKKMSIERVISIHSAAVYNVYMLGFLPGFAYMGVVDDSIATNRLATARTNVPAGSVGIAGNQTGIYPVESPGGWNIIGRTPLKIFDPLQEEPCMLQPGDAIKFIPVSIDEFNQIKEKENSD